LTGFPYGFFLPCPFSSIGVKFRQTFTVRDTTCPRPVFVVLVIFTVWELSMKAVAIMYAIHRTSVMVGSRSIISRYPTRSGIDGTLNFSTRLNSAM